ncbi:MAG: SH3 domain-containing protein [Arenimonas sp.]|nr:SH3 domain-containing protein [Arenimonas sp.]
MYARLSSNHHARYRNPLAVAAGEKVTLGIRDVDWPEFIWATDSRGRSGWIHQSLLNGDVVSRDYDAREIEGNTGDSVRLIELLGGWWWAENEIGEKGWLPEHALSIEPGIK